MDDPEVPINAVKRSYQIVDAVRERGGAGATELARALELPKSTVHNHLKTLERLGFLVPEDGHYRLGTKYLQLGREARNGRELFVHGRETLEQLEAETGTYGQLVVEENGRSAILLSTRWEGGGPTGRHVYPTHAALHTNAPGKAILAHLDDDRVTEIVDRHGLPSRTNRTVTDPDALREELGVIRQRGYAVDWGEMLEGMVGVAAPIVTEERVYGAIGSYGPSNEIQPQIDAGDLPALVTQKADAIRADIVFSQFD
jgi:DNA-binding IclR family transcriptional regulator